MKWAGEVAFFLIIVLVIITTIAAIFYSLALLALYVLFALPYQMG